MKRRSIKKWIVLLDEEEYESCRTREEARSWARWLRNHPSVRELQRNADVGRPVNVGNVRIEAVRDRLAEYPEGYGCGGPEWEGDPMDFRYNFSRDDDEDYE